MLNHTLFSTSSRLTFLFCAISFVAFILHGLIFFTSLAQAVVLHDLGGGAVYSPWGVIDLTQDEKKNLRKPVLTPERQAQIDDLIRTAIIGPPEKRDETLKQAWLILKNSRPELYPAFPSSHNE